MPKFTITTDTGDSESSTDPMEFPDTKAATDDAQVALAEMARDKLPNGKRADFGIKVENEDGEEVYRAALNFHAKTQDDIAREQEESEASAEEIAAALGKGPRD
jgi:uncharacterized protein YbaA (DUF1428 family)